MAVEYIYSRLSTSLFSRSTILMVMTLPLGNMDLKNGKKANKQKKSVSEFFRQIKYPHFVIINHVIECYSESGHSEKS